MNENRNNSYLFPSEGSSALLRTCTSCCPFDAKNIPHPYFDYSSMNRRDILGNGIATNADTCCLSKLQVECRIQRRRKKRRRRKNKRYRSSLSIKGSISSSSQLSPMPKRKKFDSNTRANNRYKLSNDFASRTSSSALSTSSNTTNASVITDQSFSSNQSRKAYQQYQKSANAQSYDTGIHINENLQNLKTSIDNLTQLLVHHQNPSQATFPSSHSTSILDRFRRFFALFKSFSKPNETLINEECRQILQRNHLTQQNLLSIYRLFDKNERIFLDWLRTIMPDHFLPLLLNYVKHFDSISTDNG